MINAGRYKVCFAELSPEIQVDVLKRMARLIEENREWYDRGNYGHLCNILPTLAIDEALQAAGKSPEESLALLSKYMWASLKPEKMQKLAEKSYFVPLRRLWCPWGSRWARARAGNMCGTRTPTAPTSSISSVPSVSISTSSRNTA